jgi:hypothetical protein
MSKRSPQAHRYRRIARKELPNLQIQTKIAVTPSLVQNYSDLRCCPGKYLLAGKDPVPHKQQASAGPILVQRPDVEPKKVRPVTSKNPLPFPTTSVPTSSYLRIKAAFADVVIATPWPMTVAATSKLTARFLMLPSRIAPQELKKIPHFAKLSNG